MDFKLWFENTELNVGRFLEEMINKAGQLLRQNLPTNPKPFADCLQQVWPSDAKSISGLVLPNNFPAGIAGQKVLLQSMDNKTRAAAIHNGNQFGGFILNINIDPKNIDADLESLKSAVHHEAEHINNPGTDYKSQADKDAATIDYMDNPGEIHAHGREMARIYAQHFPGEPFDPQKAKSLMSHPAFNQTHKNYFQGLTEPGKWDKLSAKYGRSENPHDKIASVVQKILPQYQ